METEKFEVMLTCGEGLAASFRAYQEAGTSLELAESQLQDAQKARQAATEYYKQTQQQYEDAKLALIESVEGL